MHRILFTRIILFAAVTTIQYASAQAPGWEWAKSYGGIKNDNGNSVATDELGNIYFAGTFYSDTLIIDTTILSIPIPSSSRGDVFVVKYDLTGHVLWAKKAGGTGNDQAYYVTVDHSHNVYVTGTFTSTMIIDDTTLSTTSTSDMFLLKYNSSGILLWAKSIGGEIAGNNYDYSYDVHVDMADNVYIAGNFTSNHMTIGTSSLSNFSGMNDIFLAKFDSAGNALWARSAFGNNQDYARNITTDAWGNVYLAAYFASTSMSIGSTYLWNSNDPFFDLLIVKFDPAGYVLWAKSFGGSGNESTTDMVTDSWGNVYVTGAFQSQSLQFDTTTLVNDTMDGSADIFLVKFDSVGTVLWAKSWGGNNADGSNALALDIQERPIIAGQFLSPSMYFDNTLLVNHSATGPSADIFVAKVDTSGNVLWAQRAGDNANDKAMDLAIDAWDNIYVSGIYWGGQGASSSIDTIYLPGYGNDDMFLAKIKEHITGVAELSMERHLIVFPNPCIGKFTIGTDGIKIGSNEKLEVYNMMGEKIYQIDHLPGGTTANGSFTIDLTGQHKGIYIARLTGKYGITNAKIIIN